MILDLNNKVQEVYYNQIGGKRRTKRAKKAKGKAKGKTARKKKRRKPH